MQNFILFSFLLIFLTIKITLNINIAITMQKFLTFPHLNNYLSWGKKNL